MLMGTSVGCKVRCMGLQQRGPAWTQRGEGIFVFHIHNHTHCEAQSDVKTWDARTLPSKSHTDDGFPTDSAPPGRPRAVGSVSLAEHPVGVQYMLLDGWMDGKIPDG